MPHSRRAGSAPAPRTPQAPTVSTTAHAHSPRVTRRWASRALNGNANSSAGNQDRLHQQQRAVGERQRLEDVTGDCRRGACPPQRPAEQGEKHHGTDAVLLGDIHGGALAHDDADRKEHRGRAVPAAPPDHGLPKRPAPFGPRPPHRTRTTYSSTAPSARVPAGFEPDRVGIEAHEFATVDLAGGGGRIDRGRRRAAGARYRCLGRTTAASGAATDWFRIRRPRGKPTTTIRSTCRYSTKSSRTPTTSPSVNRRCRADGRGPFRWPSWAWW